MDQKLGKDQQSSGQKMLRTPSANSLAQRLKMSPLSNTLAEIEYVLLLKGAFSFDVDTIGND